MAVVAALQKSLSVLGGRTFVRRNACGFAAARLLAIALNIAVGVLLAGALGVATTAPASAQGFVFNSRPPHPEPPKVAHDGQMLVQAVEVDYDYNNNRVSRSATCSCSTTAPASKPTR